MVAVLVARDQQTRAGPVDDAARPRPLVSPHHDASVSDARQREVVVLQEDAFPAEPRRVFEPLQQALHLAGDRGGKMRHLWSDYRK